MKPPPRIELIVELIKQIEQSLIDDGDRPIRVVLKSGRHIDGTLGHIDWRDTWLFFHPISEDPPGKPPIGVQKPFAVIALEEIAMLIWVG